MPVVKAATSLAVPSADALVPTTTTPIPQEVITRSPPTSATTPTAPTAPTPSVAPAPDLPRLTPRLTARKRQELLDLLDHAWEQGMNPAAYKAADLRRDFDALSSDEVPNELDDKFTAALVAYGRDLTGMRVAALTLGLRASDWRRRQPVDTMRAGLLAASDPQAYLASLAPNTPLYQRLQKELRDLRPRILAGEGAEKMYPVPELKRLLRPGDTHAAIPALRTRLGTPAEKGEPENLYDDRLARVVMAFQRNHGLKEDGIIGPQTIRFFNQTYAERYAQVIANLERIRWLNPEKPEKYIVVNIPAATLWAVKGDAVAFEMSVIVGRPKRPTPQFQALVTGVRLNPSWIVPETIKAQDFLPELRKDPNFLATKGIEMWTETPTPGVGRERVDPTGLDWANVTEDELAKYRMLQPAGTGNVLGKIRVLMDNPYGIYMHDTNTPTFFRDRDRNISSGCVRLSQPEEVARFVIDGMPGWTPEKFTAALKADKTREIPANPPFPVLMLYQTAWLRADGELVLGYDIYGEDARLYAALQAKKAVPEG